MVGTQSNKPKWQQKLDRWIRAIYILLPMKNVLYPSRFLGLGEVCVSVKLEMLY